MDNNIQIKRGAGIVSIQVWTDSLKGRPFPAWAVLVDLKDDGTFLSNPYKPELIALRKDIFQQLP